ncbi:MAG: class II aldolase/adducin family protein [Defluviitaleaceae bacterium]|nr:class II aldolase/adducin family protein [Defluviitaleaceae bacterium]
MQSENSIRLEICEIGRRAYEKNFVAANDGNISVRLRDGGVLCTPTGVSKGFMAPEMICRLDASGSVTDAGSGAGPSSELAMHLRIYNERPDISAVVHTHPPYATAFAVANAPLSQPLSSETVYALGCVPVAQYGTPSTAEVAENVSAFVGLCDAMLLANHGALSYGADLIIAWHLMESVEFYAKLTYMAKTIGSANRLGPDEIKKLEALRERNGASGRRIKKPCRIDANAKGFSHCANCDFSGGEKN